MENTDFNALAALVLTTNKYVDKNYANIGDNIIYTIVINNSGTTDAFNVLLTDLIPQGADFINNSVVIDGVASPGINPALGISLNTIAIGATKTITMSANIVTVPYNNPLNNIGQLDYQYVDLTTTPNIQLNSIDTNSVATTVNAVILTFIKSADESILTTVGQTINYNLFILNGGNVTAENTIIIDTVPAGTVFVPNTIKVLGVTVPGTIEPPSGFTLGNIPDNSYSCITFQVQVISIPANYEISNTALAKYVYTVDPIIPTTIADTRLSNIVTLSQTTADLSTTTKMVDKAYATINDTLTYTVIVPNTGGLDAINVSFIDTIPNGTSYISNTLNINNTVYANFTGNISIGTIAAGTTTTIQFKVKVN